MNTRTLESTQGNVKDNKVCPILSSCFTKPQLEARNNMFAELYEAQQTKIAELPKREISITLPDGKVVPGTSYQTTPFDIAKKISKKLAKDACVARIKYTKRDTNFFGKVVDVDEFEEEGKEDEWELVDLHSFLEGDCMIQIVTFDDPQGKQTMWHSSAHILGKTLEQLYNGYLTHGPPVEAGFFYDAFLGERKLTPNDYKDIEKEAMALVTKNQPFEKLLLTKEQALELFKDNPFKVKLIQAKISDNGSTSAYRCGDLIDLCTGPHLPSTGKLKAFKVTKNSSSYWLANQDNDSLQRVYAISFPSKKEMVEYEKMVKELAERDHRHIGEQQGLFHFSPLAPGCAFFLPHGTRLFNRLSEVIRHEYVFRGFTEVNTPTMFKKELWKMSGHYFKYKDDMFFVDTEECCHGLKPMNCPSHCLMFAAQLRSYRDLPIRFGDFGVLHRNEVSGALSGLTRVRKFHQDDAHIFCSQDQIQQEVKGQLDFITYIYSLFGFEFTLELSTRPAKYLGSIELWDNAEEALKQSLDGFGKEWKINEGDGAFYGPKIDIKVMDCYKRKHQLGTIQLDFNLPIRFNLQYKDNEANIAADNVVEPNENPEEVEEKKKVEGDDDNVDYYDVEKKLKPGFKRPIIVHRAILGSLERCIAILCEHYGGKWPFWLSPRQINILTVSDKYKDYAKRVQDRLVYEGFYADIDTSNLTLNKRIRNATINRYNIIAVVGENEVEKGTVTIRFGKTGEQKIMTVNEFVEYCNSLKPKPSNAELAYKQNAFFNQNEEDGDKELLALDSLLKTQSYLSEDGFTLGDDDLKKHTEITEKKPVWAKYPNLERWYKTVQRYMDKK